MFCLWKNNGTTLSATCEPKCSLWDMVGSQSISGDCPIVEMREPSRLSRFKRNALRKWVGCNPATWGEAEVVDKRPWKVQQVGCEDAFDAECPDARVEDAGESGAVAGGDGRAAGEGGARADTTQNDAADGSGTDHAAIEPLIAGEWVASEKIDAGERLDEARDAGGPRESQQRAVHAAAARLAEGAEIVSKTNRALGDADEQAGHVDHSPDNVKGKFDETSDERVARRINGVLRLRGIWMQPCREEVPNGANAVPGGGQGIANTAEERSDWAGVVEITPVDGGGGDVGGLVAEGATCGSTWGIGSICSSSHW